MSIPVSQFIPPNLTPLACCFVFPTCFLTCLCGFGGQRRLLCHWNSGSTHPATEFEEAPPTQLWPFVLVPFVRDCLWLILCLQHMALECSLMIEKSNFTKGPSGWGLMP